MQMLKKLLSSDKKYYLELDESTESKSAPKAIQAAKKVGKVAQEKTAAIANSQPTAKAVASAVVNASEKPQPGAKNSQEVIAKPAPKGKSKTAVSKSNPQSNSASSYDPPFWVAAMYNNTNNNGNGTGSEPGQTFAPDNLMPTMTKSRRRPGPSLNQFRDMAKKVRTPRS